MLRMTASEANRKLGTNFKPEKKKNKFNAIKTEIGDKKFDSRSEGDLYWEYKMQERQGLIKLVEIQVKEELFAYGKHISNYFVDFRITHLDDKIEYVEHKSKGTVQPAWQIKWKWLQAKYQNEISRGEVVCSINWYQGYKIIKR